MFSERLQSAIDAAEAQEIKGAEERIRRILAELEEETGKRIDHVEVDTRNFANLATSIILK